MAARAAPLAHRRPATKTHGILSPEEWAQIIAEEAHALGVKMTPRQVAEGVGVVMSESGGNASNLVQGPSGHIGGWSEEPGFGSTKERLDPRASTRAAIKNWKSNGKNWWQAWGQYEEGETEGAGPTRWPKYLAAAEAALKGAIVGPRSSGRQVPSETVSTSSSGGSGGLSGDLMHVGLVAALVIGGAGMVGLGVTRVFGTATKPRLA